MIKYRKYQWLYIGTDILTSILVWLSFLFFRWLVYDGRVIGIDTMLIPAFDFYRPLVLYPIVCVGIYYLSGYYIRPLKKDLWQEFLQTFISAAIITLGVFFAIVIDDIRAGGDYHRYIGSLMVLMGLQLIFSYIPRLIITLSHREYSEERTFTFHHRDDLDSYYAGHRIKAFDRVVIDLPTNSSERDLYMIISSVYPSKVEISIVPRTYDILMGAARIRDLSSSPLINISDHNMSDAELCIKRAFDIVFSVLIMLILSPIFISIAIAVRCTSAGPVIYRQERIGMYGRRFNILKYRTMYDNSEGDTPRLSTENDNRITPIGHILRKYRLDELPQMWNILRGDMSFVGPRPEREYFIRKIEEHAPYYCLLYKIRPGMTSWGPIRVGYTDTMEKMLQRLNYDIAYIENMSLGLDINIMLRTIRVLIDGRGK